MAIKGKKKATYHQKVWGVEEWIANNDKYCGKILHLKSGWVCSYHHHKIKDETFYILEGVVKMKVEGRSEILHSGAVVHIPVGTKHSFAGVMDAKILEISTQHFEEDSYRVDKSRLWEAVPRSKSKEVN